MKHPPYCPNRFCLYHTKGSAPPGWYKHSGWHETKAFGFVPRFRCKLCGTSFSTQTFSIDYYTKRPIPYSRLLKHIITTSSVRDMARDFGVSVDVVLNKIERLARNCLAAQQGLRRIIRLREDLAADGFENFTVSQFFPCHINLLAGSGSQLVYWFDYVTIRRKGRMTEKQKQERAELERRFRADPKGIETSFRRLYAYLSHLICDGQWPWLQLATDEHPAYTRAEKRNFIIDALKTQMRYRRLQVSSKEKRTFSNPLFPVNYMDRQLRKDMAENVRETVCFGRNVNRAMDRLVVYLTYHNLMKPFREVKKNFRSHAEIAGVSGKEVRSLLYGLFSKRVCFSHLKPEGKLRKMWERGYVTPLKEKPEYVPLHVRYGTLA